MRAKKRGADGAREEVAPVDEVVDEPTVESLSERAGSDEGVAVTVVELAPSVQAQPLDGLLGLIERYVVMPEAERLVTALWIVQAHCFQHFDVSGYLAVSSPEKQCGKTTLLELIELLAPRPFSCVTPSEAVIYRLVDAVQPTLLLDEVDAIFNPRTADRYEGLRAILNAGFKRGASVPRCQPPKMTIIQYEVYCPKVLAGIGELPDTIADRSFPIRMQKKTPEERVERFRARDVKMLAMPIKEAVIAWAEAHGAALGEARPDLPDELSDRQQDVSEPLLAIADALGRGDEARAALVKLLTSERADSAENAQTRLLRDIRTLFAANGDPAAIHTATLLDELKGLEGSGWDTWYDKGLSSFGLGKMLKPYGIESMSVRAGVGNVVGRGYRRADFVEAWNRYASGPVTDVTETGVNEMGTEGLGA